MCVNFKIALVEVQNFSLISHHFDWKETFCTTNEFNQFTGSGYFG